MGLLDKLLDRSRKVVEAAEEKLDLPSDADDHRDHALANVLEPDRPDAALPGDPKVPWDG